MPGCETATASKTVVVRVSDSNAYSDCHLYSDQKFKFLSACMMMMMVLMMTMTVAVTVTVTMTMMMIVMMIEGR